jgi:hypothetical protein
MKTEELKLWIIDRILKTDDGQLLSQVALLLDRHEIVSLENSVDMMREPMAEYGSSAVSEVYELNNEEEAAVLEAREQYAQGRVLSDEQVREKNARWLRN